MHHWHSLYRHAPAQDLAALAQRLRDQLTGMGYSLYDPFGLMPGPAYPVTARAFLLPPDMLQQELNRERVWLRVLIETDERAAAESLARTLSEGAPLLLDLSVNAKIAALSVWREGEPVPGKPADALQDILAPGRSADELQKAFAHKLDPPPLEQAGEVGGVPLDQMPDDVQKMAKQVNAKSVGKLFQKLSQQLLQTQDREAAQAVLKNQPDWESKGARRIRAVMACLDVPSNWRTPDFATLRQAYALQKRQERRPDAPSYPGDEEALNAVPDALKTVPVYAGRER